MKTIYLPEYQSALSLSEQLGRRFDQCGENNYWKFEAFHLSKRSITGHSPNSHIGDYYIIGTESAGVWRVIIDRFTTIPVTESETDVVVAEFKNEAEAWAWLKDPVSQAYYLLGTPEDVAEARGLSFRNESAPIIRKGDLVRILPAFQDDFDGQFVWAATEDESAGRVTITALNKGTLPIPDQTMERRMIVPIHLTDRVYLLFKTLVGCLPYGSEALEIESRNLISEMEGKR